ncbi:vitamin K epoxide reductase family protein [Nocardia sp. CDC159]|uniref:Vitamin K epoxide reductase family protein n=1 Tax=Nocardia pulmonis TaxID=2951408 RepID=A0A9X2EEK2_9NOCA|nr:MULTISPECIES: vitamin K epoxide reductase family protein [Nocardia]MCM6778971.1 vitamin K epoxide reductase family protein [Nocardia pulmonis]MCM6791860.1 vitamin K epoxide reductase family protein [Nocardia sp. CDC159]
MSRIGPAGGTARSVAMPPDWDRNPSTWPQRLPIVAAALAGFGIAAYLALYQYEVVPTVWEPFFGGGSRVVLDSPLSHVLPVSDAALGATAYLVDAITGVIGGTRRWRSMPWIVIIFGIAVGPLGTISILLVIAQPVLYGAYCTLCLVSAVISMVMIPLAMDEVLASLQHLRRVHDSGESTWRAFWGLRGQED